MTLYFRMTKFGIKPQTRRGYKHKAVVEITNDQAIRLRTALCEYKEKNGKWPKYPYAFREGESLFIGITDKYD